MGGQGGGRGGGSSERCLKWGMTVIKGSFQKHLKTGVKAKVVHRGGGFEGVTTPPPKKIFNRTHGVHFNNQREITCKIASRRSFISFHRELSTFWY